MKCPKCGFNSFDYLDNCKKCGSDLVPFKAKHGLRSLLFPEVTRRGAGPVLPEAAVTPEAALLTEATDATDFGFDFMDGGEPSADSATPAAESQPPFAGEAAEEATGEFPLPEDFSLEDAENDLLLPGGGEEDRLSLDSGGEELPPLGDPDDFSFFDAAEEPGDLLDTEVDLSSWEEEEKEPAGKRPAGPEEPADPFEQREPAAAVRVPETLPGQHPEVEAEPPPAEPAEDKCQPAIPDQDWLELDLPAAVAPAAPPVPPAATLTGSSPAVPTTDHRPPFLVGRLGAFLADLLLVGSVQAAFLILGQHLLEPQQTGLLPDPTLILRLSTPYFLILFLGCFGYFTVFHLFFGQTPGKLLFGLGVETLDGAPLSLAQAFLRSVGGLAALSLGGLGYASILCDAEGRGWNDRLAGTRVVSRGQGSRSRDLSEDETEGEPGLD